MHVASNGELQASLRLADARYQEVQAGKRARRRANGASQREDLEKTHLVQNRALRCAPKKDKKAGILRRAHEKETLLAQLETEHMADEDEDSRVRMALLREKLQAMDAARGAHSRQFEDPSFHFVPRRKMMQIQSGCIDTMCQVLDKNNRTNTWQRKDVCVVEQCMSALALRVHGHPQRCEELLGTKGAVTAIVTGMRECVKNMIIQKKGFKLIVDTCQALPSFAEAYVSAGALEMIVDAMDRFPQDWHLQASSCEAISAVVAALPPRNNRGLLEGVFRLGAHRAVGRALRRHPRSEAVIVAATRALETITLQSYSGGGRGITMFGRGFVQEALILSNRRRGHHSPYHFGGNKGDEDSLSAITTAGNGETEDSLLATTTAGNGETAGDGYCKADDSGVSVASAETTSPCPEADRVASHTATDTTGVQERSVRLGEDGVKAVTTTPFGRGRGEGKGGGKEVGTSAFALRVVDSFSRDDSRTIVRRDGAARVAASALSLVRSLLTDFRLGMGQREEERVDIDEEKGDEEKGDEEKGDEERAEEDESKRAVHEEDEEDKEDEDEAALADCVEEFCREQGVEILISAMEHHIHDVGVLLAAWQAVHAITRIARRPQIERQGIANPHHPDGEGTRKSLSMSAPAEDEVIPRNAGGGDIHEALIERENNLQHLISILARVMDIHQAVAPLQWICLVCLIDLHALEAKVSDYFMMRSGCQVLRRCIRINSQHTAVVEQSCRAVVTMSEPSFTSRTRLRVENVQDAIHEAVFLHRRHPGVNLLGNRALDALLGGDSFGARQRASAAERAQNVKEDGGGTDM